VRPLPPVILDFINKAVIHPGTGPDDDRRYQQFLAQQQQQLAAAAPSEKA
jgi:hypothetical protein